MIGGSVHLTLFMGPIVPLPVPRVVVDALQSVTVTSAADSASGFQMQFAFNTRSELNTLVHIVAGQSVSLATPALRVMIVLTIGGRATPLFDGVMTNVEVASGGPGEASTVSITGEDLTHLMDKIEFDGIPYPAMPIPARVALICAKYAAFGVVPLPIPEIFPDVPVPLEKIPAHQGTDLAYIKKLADDVGHVFYIEPGPAPGVNVAYFGPEIKIGVPQPALNIDMDVHTNVESLNFTFQPDKGITPVVMIQNQQTRVPIPLPIPNINPLQPALAALPTGIANLKILKDTAKMSPTKALSKGLAEAAKSKDSVTAKGSLNVVRYGRLLKSRQLVGVRGAGVAYDGLYYVSSVTSTISHGELKQEFNLSRNGLIPLTDRVAV